MEALLPGLMSRTSVVPVRGAVASPEFVADGAVVGREVERAADVGHLTGIGLGGAGRMSRTSMVPAEVPSLRQSSWPATPSLAAEEKQAADVGRGKRGYD